MLSIKLLKTLIALLIAWSCVVVILLLYLNYTQNTLMIEIHWKDSDRLDFDYDIGQGDSKLSRREVKNSETKTGFEKVKKKLEHIPLQTLKSLNRKCDDPLCLEYLSKLERVYFDQCKQKVVSMESNFGPVSNTSHCKFQNGSERVPVALASFPGSGNTWVRGLLERVTGICTGALYCDSTLRTKGFTGEGIRGPSSLVIKVHSKSAIFSNNIIPKRIFNDSPVYGGAILLIRDPRMSLIAEWNRQRSNRRSNLLNSNHFLYVEKEYFGDNQLWDHYVREKCARWKAHVSGWIISGRFNPFLIVRYEDLVANTTQEVIKMVEFLGYKEVIPQPELQKVVSEGYSSFHRNHQPDFEHFTPDQKELIHRTVDETITLLARYNLDDFFPISNYL